MARRCSIRAIALALSAVAAGGAACSSSGPSRPASSSADDETFASTIERLVQDKCQTCHRDGGIAPFPLLTYEQVKAIGPAAKEVVARREMPPWGALDDPSCDVELPFKDDLSLTQPQIDSFVRWVDRGMPRGDPANVNPPRTEIEPLGLADKTGTIDVAVDHMVSGGAEDDIRCFPVDPGFTEDAWIAESIVVPADPKVVHHALVYLDPNHEGVQEAAGEKSYPCFGGPELTDPTLLLAWSPGGTATSYGENTALRIPKGAHLVVQAHYHPLAERTTGRMSIEVKAVPRQPEHVATFVLIGNAESADDRVNKLLPGPDDPPSGPEFLIPSNAKDHVESMEVLIPLGIRDARVSAVGAHMHWAGVGMKVELRRRAARDGEPAKECLLNTKYDFAWQRTYTYDAPFDRAPTLRAGDKVRISCTYDNTPENRYIVRAMKEQRRTTPAAIRLGATSADEMCQAILVLVE